MTIEQMHLAVKLGLDKTEGLTYAAFEPEEIDFWLNEAIDRFVKVRYSGTNPKQESFEQSQKRVDDLRSLVKEIVISPTASSATETRDGYTISFKPNSYHIDQDDFPLDYMFFLNDEVDIHFHNEVTNIAFNLRTYPLPCTSDLYSVKINDPYSEHILHLNTARPLRLFSDKGIELVTDGQYTITNYLLKYLRKPTEVAIGTGTDCDLPEHTHREIVLLTVKVLTENIESPRYQTESVELTQSE
jgi:hypothetical protein